MGEFCRALVCLFLVLVAAPATGLSPAETPALKDKVAAGTLPPVAERLPKAPLVVDLSARGRSFGRQGGTLRTLAARPRDLRFVTVFSYARLVGYNEKFELTADLLQSFDVEEGRRFTFTLREGHKWSDGKPFTTEDFRYYWEDIANNKDLSPSGPPEIFYVDGELATFEVLDAQRLRFSWSKPNPRLLPHLAQPRPVFIYAPAHYLKAFHARYTDAARLKAVVEAAKLRGWAALHNRKDDPYENLNVDMPTLGPWKVVTGGNAPVYFFERNPFYHRVDGEGRQLPYLDRWAVEIAASSLFAAKANAGEVDFLSRGLSMADAPVLKEGEKANGYKTLLWPLARGSAYALYPNLNVTDPVWRALNRDKRWRQALSMAIDRKILNNALLFGLGHATTNEPMPGSRLAMRGQAETMRFDPKRANALLDDLGLTARDAYGMRKLSDGRLAEVLVEVDGEATDMIDALQLIGETWRECGIKLIIKPQERTILRNRLYAGQTIMVAAEGLENAIPTPQMPPRELAPLEQNHYAWPKWGQFVETKGKAGEPPDLPAARRLIELYDVWRTAPDEATREAAWHDMLHINRDELFVIGTVHGQMQPIVINARLRNVPTKGVYSWEPSALMGVYRFDEFFYDDAGTKP